ncbi:MAG: hypothetical protein LBR32_09410, partial [Propionibacteriaceae bacterium]|nr:hypothetical protein [Propionibacteriaceae bacterium]
AGGVDISTFSGDSLNNSPLAGKTVSAMLTGKSPSGAKAKWTWWLNGKKIAGATKQRLKLPKSWKGKTLKVRVVRSAKGYTTKTSTDTAKIR